MEVVFDEIVHTVLSCLRPILGWCKSKCRYFVVETNKYKKCPNECYSTSFILIRFHSSFLEEMLLSKDLVISVEILHSSTTTS